MYYVQQVRDNSPAIVFVISTGGRAAAGAEKSDGEREVSVICSKALVERAISYPGQRPWPQAKDTQPPRPDLSTPLRSARNDRRGDSAFCGLETCLTFAEAMYIAQSCLAAVQPYLSH